METLDVIIIENKRLRGNREKMGTNGKKRKKIEREGREERVGDSDVILNSKGGSLLG